MFCNLLQTSNNCPSRNVLCTAKQLLFFPSTQAYMYNWPAVEQHVRDRPELVHAQPNGRWSVMHQAAQAWQGVQDKYVSFDLNIWLPCLLFRTEKEIPQKEITQVVNLSCAPLHRAATRTSCPFCFACTAIRC